MFPCSRRPRKRGSAPRDSHVLLVCFWLLSIAPVIAATAFSPDAQTLADATLVVYNPAFPDSKSLAGYYAERRNIPKNQVISLDCPKEEEIERGDYDTAIAEPLRRLFDQNHWWTTRVDEAGHTIVQTNRIRFIALIRGVPLKIRFKALYPGDHPNPDIPGGMSNEAAVDSELAALGFFSRQISGPMVNPYFRSFLPITASEADPRLMLVARLDGPSADQVRRMIDESLAVERKGLWGWTYIDARGITDPRYKVADNWLFHIADQSFADGRPAVVDQFEALYPAGYPMTNAIFYFGWYSEQPAGVMNDPGFKFEPGAIAVHIHSFSAATVRSSTQHWVGPLIEHGAAATLGNVYEPFLVLTPMLDVFHDRLLEGMTFAESAYAAQAAISWMNTCVGDPLYRPFLTEPGVNETRDINPWAVFRDLSTKDRNDQARFLADLYERAKSNPLFYEFAGLVEERNDDVNAALNAFDKAQRTRSHANKFRAFLDELALLVKEHRQTEVHRLIQKGQAEFTGPAEHDILKFYDAQ